MNLDDFIVQKDDKIPIPLLGKTAVREEDLRIAGCDQIETAGNMMELSDAVVSTARVILHRFFCCNSFVQLPIMNVVMACVFLAAKLEDDLCYIEDMAYVCHYIKEQLKDPWRDPDDGTEEEYAELEESILHYEHQILTDLEFCVYVRKPHDVLKEYLEELKPIHYKRMSEVAQSYLSTCFKTTLAVRYSPETIVCGSILLAACSLRIFPFEKPEWWKEFDVDFEDLEVIHEEITKFNKRAIPSLKDLEDRLNEMKDNHFKTLDTTADTNANTCSAHLTFDERQFTSSSISSAPSMSARSADCNPCDYFDIVIPQDKSDRDDSPLSCNVPLCNDSPLSCNVPSRDDSPPSCNIPSGINISADDCRVSEDRMYW